MQHVRLHVVVRAVPVGAMGEKLLENGDQDSDRRVDERYDHGRAPPDVQQTVGARERDEQNDRGREGEDEDEGDGAQLE